MSFTSLTFLIFFPLVFLLHWLRKERQWQNWIVVLASYFFYGWWDYRFCALMLISTLVDFGLGLAVAGSTRRTWRLTFLWSSVVCNLGLLGFFKYCNFFSDSLVLFLGQFGWQVHPLMAEILLPVGISFYTFQTLSYTIDIYRGKLEPTRNLIDYLAFVSFFPQLVAGPIERATNLLPQFSRARVFSDGEAIAGCRDILWGFFKKLVVADRLAVFVDVCYSDPQSMSGWGLMLATVFFAFQIYCDFSAYSDIAIGTAKLLGIRLMQNFDHPYFSRSVTEFWRRWHISLSTWFRDYLFIPLGGSRHGTGRTCVNLCVTFVLSGLWHGAAWRFVFWGAINGLALIVEKLCGQFGIRTSRAGINPIRSSATSALQWACTFLVVCVGWVFFRADSMADVVLILEKISLDVLTDLHWSSLRVLFDTHSGLKTAVAILIGFVLWEWTQYRQWSVLDSVRWPLPVRWLAYTCLVWGTLRYMLTESVEPFIYFTF